MKLLLARTLDRFMNDLRLLYAKLTIKMPSKQASIFVIIEIPKAIRRTFY
jgi:hypothetical protein